MSEGRLLSDARFSVPPLWEQDWQGAHDLADGEARDLVLGQGRAAHLLNGVDGTEVTPERVAWLQLWSLHFILLGESHAAHGAGAGLTLQLLARTAFEVQLHTKVIAEPLGSGGEELEAVERLRAYAAWCFWQDLTLYNDRLDRKTQDGVWDPSVAQDLADELAADPARKMVYDALFGPLTPEDPLELSRERTRVASVLDGRRRLIAEWLRDRRLDFWRERLEDSARQGAQRYQSYFALIETGGGVSGQLKRDGYKWMYPIYSQGSMYAHGTSAELYLHLIDGVVAPRINTSHAAKTGTPSVATLGESVVMLAALKKLLWGV